MKRRAWTPPTDPTVGVVTGGGGGDERADALRSTIEAAGGTVVFGSVSTVLQADPSLVVTTDESTLSALGRRGADGPILPANTALAPTTTEALPDDLERACRLGGSVRRHPVLAVGTDSRNGEVDDGDGASDGDDEDGVDDDTVSERAIFDITLATDEPALISEYGVSSRETSVVRFRADGVVVATPVGSRGYAHRADGPLLSPALDAVAVVPIAPFETRPHRWVLPNEGLSLSVLRTDDGPVTLSVDERVVGPVDSTVTIGVVDVLSTLVVQPGNDRTNSDRNRSS